MVSPTFTISEDTDSQAEVVSLSQTRVGVNVGDGVSGEDVSVGDGGGGSGVSLGTLVRFGLGVAGGGKKTGTSVAVGVSVGGSSVRVAVGVPVAVSVCVNVPVGDVVRVQSIVAVSAGIEGADGTHAPMASTSMQKTSLARFMFPNSFPALENG